MAQKKRKILVIQPLPGMGDLFWFDDAFQSIAAHTKQPFTLMTKRQSQADKVYQGSAYVKDVVWLDRLKQHAGLSGFLRLVQVLREGAYTDVWILHKSWRYRTAARFAGVPNIYALPKATFSLHPTERAVKMLKAYGVTPLLHPKFPLSKTAIKNVQKAVPAQKTKSVVLAIGGTEENKKWSLENWVVLGTYFSKKKYVVSILGGPREKGEAETIARHIEKVGGVATPYTQFTIPESLAFIDAHTFLVGNDTGIMNGAAVLNKPTFALFLASPPLRYRPQLTPILADAQGKISVAQVQEVVAQHASSWSR